MYFYVMLKEYKKGNEDTVQSYVNRDNDIHNEI